MDKNPLLLSSENIFQYLAQRNLIGLAAQSDWQIEPQSGKNFNLSIRSTAGGMLLKQERLNPHGTMLGELLNEWVVCQLLQQLPLRSGEVNTFNPQVIDFDRNNSAIIFKFLVDYQDLSLLYNSEPERWSLEIPRAIGSTIATIHHLTFDRQDYRDFLLEHLDGHLTRSLVKIGRLSPEIFGAITSDGIKFYTLYQRYASLETAIDRLIATTQSRCLIHNDFKLNNILLHQDWEERGDREIVRPIDWERGTWGDPAIDLGNFIASYLQIWLSNLVVNKTMRIEESLELAVIPLDAIRPSISALVNGYLAQFPEILGFDPHFLSKVVQCAGFSLIQQIEAIIQYEKNLSNRGICTLQVAKSLLCNPDESMSVIFDRSR